MTISARELKGTFTAIVTPFSADSQQIDIASFERLIEAQLAAKVQGIVVCGSTGEAMTLSDLEYSTVIREALRVVRKRTILIAGIGANNTLRAATIAAELSASGLDGLMVVAPPYNKPPPEGIIAHVQEVKKAGRLPIVFYNVPGRTGINVLPKTVATLANQKLIVGVKEACGSLEQVLDLLSLLDSEVSVLSGDDSLTVPMMSVGARGVISVASNIVPKLMVAMTSAALEGQFERAGHLQRKVLPLVRALFSESNPIPVKAALEIKKMISSGSLRLPLVPAKAETRATIERLLSSDVELQ